MSAPSAAAEASGVDVGGAWLKLLLPLGCPAAASACARICVQSATQLLHVQRVYEVEIEGNLLCHQMNELDASDCGTLQQQLFTHGAAVALTSAASYPWYMRRTHLLLMCSLFRSHAVDDRCSACQPVCSTGYTSLAIVTFSVHVSIDKLDKPS